MNRRAGFWISSVAAAAAIAAARASAQPLPPGVDDCLARIEEQRVAGAEAGAAPRGDTSVSSPGPSLLGDVCPELAAAINEGPWGEALAGTSADELTTSAFRALTELVPVYERPAARELELRSDSLDDVLAELQLKKPAAEPTIWERIQHWYDEHFGSQSDSARSWLEKWLGQFSPSERGVRYLVIVLGVTLVVATVVIVLNELRVAGVLAGGVLRKYSPLAPVAAEPGDTRMRDIDDVLRAPFARRPVLLLALVLDRLRTRGSPALRASLTHRELLGAASGLSAEQRTAFEVVVGAAERVTFADWQPEERDLDRVLVRGRALLASLPTDASGQR